MTIIKNGVKTTYTGWSARARLIPTLAGVSLLVGGTLLGAGIVTTATGVALAAIPATILYGGYRGLASVVRAAKNIKLPPPGAKGELAESAGVNVSLSIVVPITATSLVNNDSMYSLLDGFVKENALVNNQELAEQIINLSGILSISDSTINQINQNGESDQKRNYLVVLLAEELYSEKTKLRELSRYDVDSIVSNRTFLHHKSEFDLIKYDGDITNFLFENIKHYSTNVAKSQFHGCVLYLMISNDIARIAFVPFS